MRFFLILAAVALALPAVAQPPWLSVTGRVLDSTGAAIPDAVVTARNPALGISRTVSSAPDGSFSLTFLPPGEWQVRAEASGFRDVRRDLSGVPGDLISLTFDLPVSEYHGNLTVLASAEPVYSDTAARSTSVDSLQMRAIPILGRQVYNVISLSPGVLFAQQQFTAGGYNSAQSWTQDGQYIINGGLPGTNQFLMDNSPVSLTGKWQIAPAAEAVEEMRVLTNTYDAQYGRTGGGTVISTLRAGGARWHGGGYEYFGNAVLDANSFENNQAGAGRGKHIAHQFGGTLGGPLRRDRDFLFLSMDVYRETLPAPLVSSTPPEALRSGNFARYGIQIYDPWSTKLCQPADQTPCATKYTRTLFPGDVIPSSLISPAGREILSLYPQPNQHGITSNYDAPGVSSTYNYFQPIARWDHLFSDRDRLDALFAFERSVGSQSANGFPGAAAIGTGNAERTSQHYTLDWTRIPSPDRIGNLGISFGRFTQFFPESNCLDCRSASDLGIHMPHAPTVDGDAAPRIDLELFNSIISNTFTWQTENQIDFSPNLILNLGRHTFHLGGEIALAGIGQNNPGRANGEFSFTSSWTQQAPVRSSGFFDGSAVADLLLGLPTSGFIDYNPSAYFRWPYFAGYVQDNWKVSSVLTLNLGLRYDVQIPFTELHNRIDGGFDPNATNPLSDRILANWKSIQQSWNADHPGVPYPDPPSAIRGAFLQPSGRYRRPYDTDWTDIQPRLGLAWNMGAGTILRAGAGIFYRTATQLGTTYGFSQRTYYHGSDDGGLTPASPRNSGDPLSSPFPNGLAPVSGGQSLPTAGLGLPVQFDNRHRPIPRTYQYSAGFEKRLPLQMLLTADYAGSTTVHDALAATLDTDAFAAFGSSSASLTTPVTNPFYGVLPAGTDLGSTRDIYIGSLLRPYPAFNGIVETNFPVARYRYDSLQIKLEKRVFDVPGAGILSFLFSYTLSKSFADDHRLNSWDLSEKPLHELAATDQPQSIGSAGTWDIPIGWGRRYLSTTPSGIAALINSWTLDWTYTYASGIPVNEPDANFRCSSYAAPQGQSFAHWFNSNSGCWQLRQPHTRRTNPDRFPDIRTPSRGQLNLALEKTVWLNDRLTMHLRGEAFNLTNTPIFAAPNINPKDPEFGRIPPYQINFPRFIQIALKFSF